ncbi:MAG: glycosyltransferase [Chloroflexi bacterium]|nr:glycosyltransferase [Chloroflexota bacterium]
MTHKHLDSPLVSIVTPVLNGIKYLETCIQSVLAQSYPNIEHIFVDGGSTDGTLEMLAGYQSRYPDRVRFVSQRDEGVGEALNRGLKMARGDIFGWLDSDDLYEPDAIAVVVSFFKANQDACFVFGGSDVINATGEIIGKHPVKDWDTNEAINDRHYIVMGAAFYRREVIQKVGYFNTLGNDLDFWLRVAQVFPMHRMDNTLFLQRRHEDSFTLSTDPRKIRINWQRYREDYLLCRKYGGSILAPRARRYFIFLVLDRLKLYRFVAAKLLPGLRSHSFTNKVLKLLGA